MTMRTSLGLCTKMRFTMRCSSPKLTVHLGLCYSPTLPNQFDGGSKLPTQPAWSWPKDWPPKPSRPDSKVSFPVSLPQHQPQPQRPATLISPKLNTSKSSTPHTSSSACHPTLPQLWACITKQPERLPPGIKAKSLGHTSTASLFQMVKAQSPT